MFDLNTLSIKMIDLTLKEYSVWQQQKHVLLKLIRIFFHTDDEKAHWTLYKKLKYKHCIFLYDSNEIKVEIDISICSIKGESYKYL